MNLCSNNTLGTRNILRTMNHRHSKYPEKINNNKERKKLGPEIAYGGTHSYGSSAFELSRFHCITDRNEKQTDRVTLFPQLLCKKILTF